MLRKTTTLHIVPQAHAMMPHHCKIRGHLYRPSRLNFYCRLASTTRYQRSTWEEIQWIFGLNPDVTLTFIAVLGMATLGLGYGYIMSTYNIQSHKNNQFAGSLNTSERFQRNTDMDRIFENHRKRAAAFCEESGTTPNAIAPVGYSYATI